MEDVVIVDVKGGLVLEARLEVDVEDGVEDALVVEVLEARLVDVEDDERMVDDGLEVVELIDVMEVVELVLLEVPPPLYLGYPFETGATVAGPMNFPGSSRGG